MIQTQSEKVVVLTQPAAIVNNAAITVSSIDTNGFDYVDLFVLLGATDIALTVLKLTESDDDSAYSDVAGTLFGAGTAPALPIATDDNKLYAFRVTKTGSRKRYLKPAVTIGNGATGAFVVVVAVLSRAKQFPGTAATRGCAGEVIVA